MQRYVGERRVGRAEVDADAKAGLCHGTGAGGRLLRADLELHLPAALRVRVLHPQLEISEFGDDRVNPHRHRLPRGQLIDRRQIDLQQARLLQFAFRIREDLSRPVAASHLG